VKGYMNSSHKVLELSVNLNDSIDTPILSAIVPVTRMAGRLGLLENWLCEVENLPVEVIIIHDIQDESTSQELQEVIGRHKKSQIKLLEGEFGSPGAARNAGLDFQRRIWTAFWDSDDLPKVTVVLEGIRSANSNADVVIGNYSINNNGHIKEVKHFNRLDFVAINPGLWRMAFKTDLIKEKRFALFRMGEDKLFLADLNLKSRNIHFTNKIFYIYNKGQPFQLTSSAIARKDVYLPLIEVQRIMDCNTELRNSFSEIIKIRLFLTLLRNQEENKWTISNQMADIKRYKLRSRYMFLVAVILVINKFSLFSIFKRLNPRRP
jgi:hypothetical protein